MTCWFPVNTFIGWKFYSIFWWNIRTVSSSTWWLSVLHKYHGLYGKMHFFSDWMDKTSYIRKKKTNPNTTSERGAPGTNTWRTTHSFLKLMPFSHTRVVAYLAAIQVLVNNIKHNLGIKATEHRSFSCRTSTDQILKIYVYDFGYFC